MTSTMMCWKSYFWNGVVGYDGSPTWTTRFASKNFPHPNTNYPQLLYDSSLFTHDRMLLEKLFELYDVNAEGSEVRGKRKPWKNS